MRRRLALLVVVLLVTPLLAACDVADQPDGWAAPTAPTRDPDDELDTRLIAPTGERTVIALELLDGNIAAPMWEFPDEDGNFSGLDGSIEPVAFYADPVWVPETEEWLFGGYSDGVLYAVQGDGSSARAVFDTGARIVADLEVKGTRVYLADTSYCVHAVDIEQPGASLWSWDGDSDLQIWGGPKLIETEQGALLIVAGLDGRITALQADGPNRGEPAWQISIEAGIAGSIEAANGIVYVGGLDRVFYGLDAETGSRIWTAQASHWIWGTPLIRDGVVYLTDLRGNVYALDALTGQSRWLKPYATGDLIRARPLFVEFEDPSVPGGILIIVARGGAILQLNAVDGSLLRQFQLEQASDLMANAIRRDDRIVVGDENGVLYAVLLGANQAVRLYPPN